MKSTKERMNPEKSNKEPAQSDFARMLRDARQRAAGGNCQIKAPSSAEMVKDRSNGEFWRRLAKARERLREWKDHNQCDPEQG